MALGLASSFDILRTSPYDLQPSPCSAVPEAPVTPKKQRWVASPCPVRASTEDGWLAPWQVPGQIIRRYAT